MIQAAPPSCYPLSVMKLVTAICNAESSQNLVIARKENSGLLWYGHNVCSYIRDRLMPEMRSFVYCETKENRKYVRSNLYYDSTLASSPRPQILGRPTALDKMKLPHTNLNDNFDSCHSCSNSTFAQHLTKR